MKVTGKGTVYKNQYGWSISDNQKQQDGSYNNFYIPIYFKKELPEPEDRDFISIEGFTKPFKYKDDKVGISYIVIDWEKIGAKKEENTSTEKQDAPVQENNEQVDPFAEFGQEVVINDEDLPF